MALTLSGTNKIVNDNLNTEVKTLLTPKNWIINGGFDVWQRGTSQTYAGYGSDDRWNNQNVTSTKTHLQQAFTVGQTDVPNNPTYYSRTIVTTGGTSSSYILKYQNIEDVTKLAGKTVSLSFWAKADAPKNMSIEFVQNFGTGGSGGIVGIGVQKFSLTTSWQRFTKTVTIPSVSGKTIVAGNYLGLSFWLDAGSLLNSRTDSLGNQSGTFDIANVSLVEGSVPVEWQTEAYADVLRQCQRYASPLPNAITSFTFIQRITSANAFALFNGNPTRHIAYFPVEMRVAPTFTAITADGFGGYVERYTTTRFLSIRPTNYDTGNPYIYTDNVFLDAEL